MMNTLDCTDIQALLSALIDGEVEDGVRHQAERHLAECQRCRERINEAEALDELIQSGVASMIDPGGLPQGFENRVLSRTIYQQAHRPYLQQWTTWGGWAAAAAALALAITIWVSDRRAGVMPVHQSGLVSPGLSAGTGSQVKTAVYSTGSQHRSLTLDRTLGFDELRSPPDATDVLEQGADVEPDITVRQREDAETLYFTAVLLQMLQEASDPSPEDLDELRLRHGVRPAAPSSGRAATSIEAPRPPARDRRGILLRPDRRRTAHRAGSAAHHPDGVGARTVRSARRYERPRRSKLDIPAPYPLLIGARIVRLLLARGCANTFGAAPGVAQPAPHPCGLGVVGLRLGARREVLL